jgi:hypothetical protein
VPPPEQQQQQQQQQQASQQQQQPPIQAVNTPTTAPPRRSKSRSSNNESDSDGGYDFSSPPVRGQPVADPFADPFTQPVRGNYQPTRTAWDAPTAAPERRSKQRAGGSTSSAGTPLRAPPGAPLFAPQRRTKDRRGADETRERNPGGYMPFPGRGGFTRRRGSEDEFDMDMDVAERGYAPQGPAAPTRRSEEEKEDAMEQAEAMGLEMNEMIQCAL